MNKTKRTNTVSKAKKRTWEVFSKFIRMRDCLLSTKMIDWGKCFTCGKEFSIKNLQAGHFIQGRHNAILFNEGNCHAQCYRCNVLLHGALVDYTIRMVDKYGITKVTELKVLDKQIKQFTIPELDALKDYYIEKIKKLEWKGVNRE